MSSYSESGVAARALNLTLEPRTAVCGMDVLCGRTLWAVPIVSGRQVSTH